MTGLIYNMIPETGHRLTTTTSDWLVSSGSATLAISGDVTYHDDASTLLVTPSSGTATVTTGPHAMLDEDAGWPLRGTVWAYATAPRTITMTVTRASTSTDAASTTVQIPARRWTLVSVDGPTTSPEQINTGRLSLTTNGATYFAWPTLAVPNTATHNMFAAETWSALPEYLRASDEEQQTPDHPLYRFMDVMYSSANDLMLEWMNVRYFPPDDWYPFDSDSLSTLVSPSVCPPERLLWLGQFVGTTVVGRVNGFTSWQDLMASMVTWSQWETVADTADAGTTVQWSELENFKPTSSGLDALMRWQVSSGAFGMHGGTNAALIDATKQVLTGTKTVTVQAIYAGDPWKIGVLTKASESPDNVAVNSSSATIVELLSKVAPVGYEIVHSAALT